MNCPSVKEFGFRHKRSKLGGESKEGRIGKVKYLLKTSKKFINAQFNQRC